VIFDGSELEKKRVVVIVVRDRALGRCGGFAVIALLDHVDIEKRAKAAFELLLLLVSHGIIEPEINGVSDHEEKKE
jgi:hypothetical protein